MTIGRAMEVLANERECVKKHPKCGMDCEKCKIPSVTKEELIEAINAGINALVYSSYTINDGK